MQDTLEEYRIKLTKRIIEKGGLFSMFSQHYINDTAKGNELLREFFEQLHHKDLWNFWGVELGLELVWYRCMYLRNQLNQIR